MKYRWMLCILVMTTLALGCSSSDMARVTIVIGDYTTAKAEAPSIIDRVLMLFGTRAEAMSTNWPDAHGDILLKIEGDGLETIETLFPAGTDSFSTEVPAGTQRRITVKSTITGTGYLNYGGSETIDLNPGDDVTLPIRMIPIVEIFATSGGMNILLNWDNANTLSLGAFVSGYNLYRSDSPEGGYSFLGYFPNSTNAQTSTSNTPPLILPVSYYYRVTVVSSEGEGLPSEPASSYRSY
ncbi:MAG: hypothetical protein EPN93_04655 [Spirochaetes bacterium]|nr:MAG: hypothetical protein EPN93_04655 [Spirochaetota bacterium]